MEILSVRYLYHFSWLSLFKKACTYCHLLAFLRTLDYTENCICNNENGYSQDTKQESDFIGQKGKVVKNGGGA